MKFKSKVKKLVVTTGMLFMLALIPAIPAYAAGPGEQTQTQTQQSPRWEGTGDTWKVKTADNTSYVTNAWFQDQDGSWYMLGNDGVMYAGLITDQSTGKSYLLNTQHDGTFGRMLTANGAYTVNGKPVNLTFNQSHDGTYGAITGGLTEARNTGVRETQLSSVPVESANTNTSNLQAPQNTEQAKEPQPNYETGEFLPGWRNKPYEQMTEAERDQRRHELEGGTTAHPDNIDMNAAQELANSMNNQ